MNRVVVVDWVFDCYDAKSELSVASYGYAFNADHADQTHEAVVSVMPPAVPSQPEPAPRPVMVPEPVVPTPAPEAPAVLSTLFDGVTFVFSKDFRHRIENDLGELLRSHSAKVGSDGPPSFVVVPHGHEALDQSIVNS